jgi:hypothetical protein
MVGFEINLKEFVLGDVLQFLTRVKKTGVLKITGGVAGEIYIRDGLVVHASDNVEKGMEALINLSFVGLETGKFELGVNAPEQTISEDFGKLTESIEKRKIEFQEIKKKLPPMETILAKSTRDLESAVALRRTDWQILALIDGKRTVREVIGESKIGGYEATKTITWLKDQGLIYDPREAERVVAQFTKFLDVMFASFGKHGVQWLHKWGEEDESYKKLLDAVKIDNETCAVEPIGELDPEEINKGIEAFKTFVSKTGPKTYGKVLFKKKWQDFLKKI